MSSTEYSISRDTALWRSVRWSRKNLFSSPVNGALTFLVALVLVSVVPPFIQWSLIDATFFGESRSACTGEGACWAVITARFKLFVRGFYDGSSWRLWLVAALLAAALVPILKDRMNRRGVWLIGSVSYPLMAFWLLYGGLGLEVVETSRWGGLLLTMIIGVVGIASSLPIGILLALGRQSDLPAVRLVSILFIEFVRGVPLITILFMGQLLLPLFLPEGVDLDDLLRALIVVALFSAAYMAEVVRGGLQAIPAAQYEAARALGFGYWQMMGLIVLPQALRIVIPGIVNSFISLFKDTTLVAIIGLFDLLGTAQAALADPNWLGLRNEVYVFTGIVFWIFCFAMSRYSMALEARLGGTREQAI